MTPKRAAFVREYLIDLNATQAAIRAGYSAKSASTIGEALLRKYEIKAAVAAAMKERAGRTEITADRVLERLWMIATADPNELIQHRRVCCRWCYGADHAFQWADAAEWEAACTEAVKVDAPIPSHDGGFGFDPTLSPHAKCPHCHGEGQAQVFAADTRDLSPAGRALFAGIKTTKDGIEIKMHDQLAALDKVARHLGMFNDKLTLKGDAENPLALLVREIQGRALPVVQNPPEDEE